ncbi:MAG: PilT protein domain protein [Devosia sp.]|uniref:PIN domain-containing protein n=1 Tax=Devosia sp. TaxID=1871048 RepID=UPI00262979CC|nr:type II toxin-antitoxin system VapC family toxin [Devosia sp.]MDB5539825.1 PilT protein domain protein [Devosia sp.]
MIGVDTNILVRLFVPVEPQREASIAFFAKRSSADPAYVSLLVVAEFAWVLRRRYKYDFGQIAQGIGWMLDSDDFVLENRDLIEWALANFTRARIDFSDLLIARAGELAGASRTVTFDVAAAKYVPGMELLK